MDRDDFKELRITHISPSQIEDTGANLADVSPSTIATLDSLLTVAGRQRVVLLSLTTGVHLSPEHDQGLAVDWAFDLRDGPVDIRHYVPMAYWVGFRGVGAYHNGKAHSMHTDIGDRFRQWAWVKEKEGDAWVWVKRALINDPADF